MATCITFFFSFIPFPLRFVPLPPTLLRPLSVAVRIEYCSTLHHSRQQEAGLLLPNLRSFLLLGFLTSFPLPPLIGSLRIFKTSCKWADSDPLFHPSSLPAFADFQVQLLLPVLHRLAPLYTSQTSQAPGHSPQMPST